MSLYHAYSSPPFYLPIDSPNPRSIFECLSTAHEMGVDHSQLIRDLQESMMTHNGQLQLFIVPICKYLRTNLELNIQIIETINCLPLIHSHTSPLIKKQITSTLCEKYPSSICFYEQITALTSINMALLQPFVKLMRALARWMRKEIEEKDYCDVEKYQIQYIVNALYAEERYKFENGCHIEESECEQTILALYRTTAGKKLNIDDDLWKKLMDCFFYYLCNMGIDLHEGSKYIYFSIGEMMSLGGSLMEAQGGMPRLIMPKVRKAANKENSQEAKTVLNLLRDGIINLLACTWTIEVESFWLWRLKLICDLLSIQDRHQLFLMRQVRAIYREISKYISN